MPASPALLAASGKDYIFRREDASTFADGTAAAGEFIANPRLAPLPPGTALDFSRHRIQFVLETTVTDGTAGPPRIVATSVE